MMTFKQLKAAQKRAETAAFNWYCKYENELENFFVSDGGAQLFSLKEFYRYHRNKSIADIIESDGVDVYEEDDDASLFSYAKYKKCTRRAIARLRKIEEKIEEWDARNCVLESAIDEYNSEYGLGDDIVAELERFGYKVR